MSYHLGWLSNLADQVEVCVVNRGLPIPADRRELIWHPFVRSTPTRNQAKGMGLGLAVVKLAATAAGWEVGIRDPAEPGTIAFFVRFPVESQLAE